MTRSKTLFALATATLLTARLFSTPVTQYLKLTVTDNSNLSVQQPTSILVSFSDIGSDAFDANDIGNQNALGSLDERVYPFTLTDDNSIITQQDAMSALHGYKRIHFGFATKFASTIKIIASAFGNTSDSTNRPVYAWIEQISTGYIYPILNDTVKIDVPANINFTSDFYLHTGPRITKTAEDESCFHAYDGDIMVHNPFSYNWAIKLYKNTTLVLNSAVNQPDTAVQGLTFGTYSVVTCINSIPVDSSVQVISGPAQIIPDFSIDNYNPTTDDVVTFENASSGAISYNWDFGDGYSDTATNTSHQFIAAGNYGIVLTATNEIGCQETVYDSVFVTGTFAPMHQSSHSYSTIGNPIASNENTATKSFDPTVIVTPGTERITIGQNDEQILTIRIMDMSGRYINGATSAGNSIELSVPQAGMYIVQMSSSTGEVKSKTVLVRN